MITVKFQKTLRQSAKQMLGGSAPAGCCGMNPTYLTP